MSTGTWSETADQTEGFFACLLVCFCDFLGFVKAAPWTYILSWGDAWCLEFVGIWALRDEHCLDSVGFLILNINWDGCLRSVPLFSSVFIAVPGKWTSSTVHTCCVWLSCRAHWPGSEQLPLPYLFHSALDFKINPLQLSRAAGTFCIYDATRPVLTRVWVPQGASEIPPSHLTSMQDDWQFFGVSWYQNMLKWLFKCSHW